MTAAYLLDTNVVSEPVKRRPNQAVVEWLAGVGNSGYLSVLTIGELRRGERMLARRDPRQAEAVATWIAGIEDAYRDQIIDLDIPAATRWGEISAAGRTPPIVDALIAATALAHDLTLVTRNVQDFEGLGVRTLNPFG
ncbi:type II toxin-antitoxin system VapC family toxin [Tsukamurella hominis]